MPLLKYSLLSLQIVDSNGFAIEHEDCIIIPFFVFLARLEDTVDDGEHLVGACRLVTIGRSVGRLAERTGGWLVSGRWSAA